MRIEANDEAARLRPYKMPIQGTGASDQNRRTDSRIRDSDDPHSLAARECDDCCQSLLSCRCSPGEG